MVSWYTDYQCIKYTNYINCFSKLSIIHCHGHCHVMVLLREILELQRQLGQRDLLQGIRAQEVFRSWVDQSKTAQLEKQLQQMGEKRLRTGIVIKESRTCGPLKCRRSL